MNPYHGPLEDFVARRTALVRQLRATDRDGADNAARLRKPPAGVWAIDQLAVDRPELVTTLLAAGADARAAHQNLAAGTESREDLALATSRLRDSVDATARAAFELLERAGHGTGEAVARRVRTTLLAGATGGAAERHALWTGTLDHDLDVAGFGAVEDSEEDGAELTAAITPLRRKTAAPPRAQAEAGSNAGLSRVERREAERDLADREAAAERARALADAKRREADRKADEARIAAEDASAAEHTADAAEQAARTARLALDS